MTEERLKNDGVRRSWSSDAPTFRKVRERWGTLRLWWCRQSTRSCVGDPWLCQELRCLRMTAFRTANASFRFHPKTSPEDQAVWLVEEVPGFAVVGPGVRAAKPLGRKQQRTCVPLPRAPVGRTRSVRAERRRPQNQSPTWRRLVSVAIVAAMVDATKYRPFIMWFVVLTCTRQKLLPLPPRRSRRADVPQGRDHAKPRLVALARKAVRPGRRISVSRPVWWDVSGRGSPRTLECVRVKRAWVCPFVGKNVLERSSLQRKRRKPGSLRPI